MAPSRRERSPSGGSTFHTRAPCCAMICVASGPATTLVRSMTVTSSRGSIFLSPIIYCRSEEHTSELQSLMRISYAVFCLKKKNYQKAQLNISTYILIHKCRDNHTLRI